MTFRPDYGLNIYERSPSSYGRNDQRIRRFGRRNEKVKPDILLVHGDTTTTFIAGLVASPNQIQVGHVEAGLRTWNKYSPYPEEMNRQLAGVLADLHFAPPDKSAANLQAENKKEERIFVTGNTAIDALKTTVKKEDI